MLQVLSPPDSREVDLAPDRRPQSLGCRGFARAYRSRWCGMVEHASHRAGAVRERSGGAWRDYSRRNRNGNRQSRTHDHCRDLRLWRNSEPLLRLQHTGESVSGLRQDRSTPVSGDIRSIFRPASARSGCARQGPYGSRALSAARRSELDRAAAGRGPSLRRQPGRGDSKAGSGACGRCQAQSRLYRHHFSSKRYRCLTQRNRRANGRRELPDADAVSHRHRPQTDGGGYQHQRRRHGRDQGRRQGHFYRRCFSPAGLSGRSEQRPSVATDGAERRHLRCRC